jgi:hypothetical protein
MTNRGQMPDALEPNLAPKKLTDTLNIVSILTFIGCALVCYFSISAYSNAAETLQTAVDAQGKISSAPSIVQSMAGPNMVESARRALEYRLPILIIGLAGVFLCAWGAFRMRSLVKTGFYFYVAGELLPFATNFFLSPSGIFAVSIVIIGLIIAAIFIALYAGQLKYMK